MTAAYLFLNYSCILAYQLSFSNALCSIYRSNQPLLKIHVIAQIYFDYFAIDKSNQVKISLEIMRWQGYFLKIPLATRVVAEENNNANALLSNFKCSRIFRKYSVSQRFSVCLKSIILDCFIKVRENIRSVKNSYDLLLFGNALL